MNLKLWLIILFSFTVPLAQSLFSYSERWYNGEYIFGLSTGIQDGDLDIGALALGEMASMKKFEEIRKHFTIAEINGVLTIGSEIVFEDNSTNPAFLLSTEVYSLLGIQD